MNGYREILIDCGWNKAFVNAITEEQAERLAGMEDPDDQIRYAETLDIDYKGDGLYE